MLSELTPQMRQVLERMQRARRQPMHAMAPADAKLFYAQGSGVLDLPHAPMAHVQTLHLPARDGTLLHAKLWLPSLTPPQPLQACINASLWPVLLFFHGGGFTVGSVATHESICRQLALRAQCAVVSVDYRLAPEHTYPTAVHDAWDAYVALRQWAPLLNLDTDRMAVGGDSAGGTLATVVALMARDANLPLVQQILFYPGTCANQGTASHQKYATGYLLESASLSYFFNLYTPNVADRQHWWFAPLHMPDAQNVAPCWLGLAECDPLIDEGIAYADHLRMARVPVDLEIYRGVVHEFIKMGRAIPQAQQALQDAANALKQAFLLR
jgi:acetyl esterase